MREARQRQEELERQQQSSDTGDINKKLGLGDKPKSGEGLKTGNGFIACLNNIADDGSRLEVLIGGKRAGNNSREIINEAADICQRLFQLGIMDINIYRGLIDEFADGYYSY